MRFRNFARTVASVAVATCAFGAAAQGQPYPSKPIRMVIVTAPGGGTDAIGRVIGEALATSMKTSVVPENRAGAAGQIASDQLVRSAPDGHAIMIVQNAHVTNPAFYRKLPYDTLKDFTPIAPVATSPLVLVAAAGTNVRNMKELVQLGRRDPGAMSFAFSESSSRMAVEQLGEATGMKLTAVSYKGTGPAVADVAGGHVNFTVTTMASVLPFRNTGKLNFIGVLAGERSSFLPEVPSMAEQGFPSIEVKGWWGIFGPANMPPAVVDLLNREIRAAQNTPEVRARIQKLQADLWQGSPKELDTFVRQQIPAIQALAKKAGIEPE